MCGIYGFIHPKNLPFQDGRELLRKMGDEQLSRGPDNRQELILQSPQNQIGFGFVRLSILDLKQGMQPIFDHQTGSSIICNGQIYNYIELKKGLAKRDFQTSGDMEVVLKLYDEAGLNFLQHLNGMYAGAIHDKRQNRLILFRDRFGIKPLYYRRSESGFFFSSEIKPLLVSCNQSATLNSDRLSTFFSMRFIPGKETLFRGIFSLPPASFIIYDLECGKITVEKYWQFSPQNETTTTYKNGEAEEQFFSLFKDAVKLRLRSDVEIGSLISSGIDSLSVSAVASEQNPVLKLFTLFYNEKRFDELAILKECLSSDPQHFSQAEHFTHLCKPSALSLLPEMIRSTEEPLSLGAQIPTYLICKEARKKVKVVLTGEGADEIFGGYRKFVISEIADRFNYFSATEQKKYLSHFPELHRFLAFSKCDAIHRYLEMEKLFNTSELTQLLGQGTPVNNDIFPRSAVPPSLENYSPINQMIACENSSRLPDYVILRLDKLSMANSLETRTPFLDYRLAEFAASLPLNKKISMSPPREKAILRDSFSHSGLLSPLALNQPKKPFTMPLVFWLAQREHYPEIFKEFFFGDLVKKQGVLDPDFVERENTAYFQSTESSSVNAATLVSQADRVFSLLVFSIWHNEFFSK